jgi:PadR family transcriptional regulator PadR
MNRERLKGHLDLLLLSVLAFDLPEGTVYPALHRLEDAGLLSSSWAMADGRRRRVYALTGDGATALAAEQTEYRSFTRGIQAVVGWSA